MAQNTLLPVYLDYCATSPVDPTVAEVVMSCMVADFGNSGSRTHEFGANAKRHVEAARRTAASALGLQPHEVVFTSGATESNNLAILGLAESGRASGRTHIVTSAIEHKSVLEPCRHLEAAGFSITYVPPLPSGMIDLDLLAQAITESTLLVSIIHANNETGLVQPAESILAIARDRGAFVHFDMAQSFCKIPNLAFVPEVDLVSISGHKIGAPKGIGALGVNRRRGVHRLLRPIMFGGGQEGGLRSGTLPVPLIAGLGKAIEIRSAYLSRDYGICLDLRERLLDSVQAAGFKVIGTGDSLPNCVCLDFSPIDAEAVFVALRGHYCVSNGSACTSASRSRSHVLQAMALPDEVIDCTVRISWNHTTELEALLDLVDRVALLR